MSNDTGSNGQSEGLDTPDLQRKREVFALLDKMEPDASFDTVCSWIRRRLAWYDEHFTMLAAAVDRAEYGKAAQESYHEITRLQLEVERWKAIAESHGAKTGKGSR